MAEPIQQISDDLRKKLKNLKSTFNNSQEIIESYRLAKKINNWLKENINTNIEEKLPDFF